MVEITICSIAHPHQKKKKKEIISSSIATLTNMQEYENHH